ncbi:DNA polymerase III, clamp loader complex, gamma/delta/delta subunit [Lipomyces kononenkoae]
MDSNDVQTGVNPVVHCPICDKQVPMQRMNMHLDIECASTQTVQSNIPTSRTTSNASQQSPSPPTAQCKFPESSTPTQSPVASIFNRASIAKRKSSLADDLPRGTDVSPAIADDRNVRRRIEEQTENQRSSTTNIGKSTPTKIAKDVQPLADRARPKNLDEFVGQENLVGKKTGILRRFIESDSCPSLIFWGPSGVGKTTLARIIARSTKSRFVELSATSASVADCKKVFEEARNELRLTGRRTYLFLDEVHRFNKAQQDVFLPYIERGDIVLIGATTENPSFKVNSALISRCRVFILQKLSQEELYSIISRLSISLASEHVPAGGSSETGIFKEDALRYLAGLADGDGRMAINLLEILINSTSSTSIPITLDQVKTDLQRTHLLYDRLGDAHYDTISAFHKSVRGSNPDATLFYLARMLESGESALYVARRMIRIASEDVGLADDSCLPFAIAAYAAVEKVGMPECDLALAHCAVKLAMAKKSVKVYRAYNAAKSKLHGDPEFSSAPIPIHLRNAPTRLMKEIGYGRDYKYNPDYENGQVQQEYFPENLRGTKFLPDIDLGTKLDDDLYENMTLDSPI